MTFYKIITIRCIILMMIILGFLAANAQTQTNITVNYSYDAAGNRVQRTITVIQAFAPTPNNNKDSIIAIQDEINSIIASDSIKANANSVANILVEGDIKVFPNPVKYKLNVQFKGTASAEGCKLQIYDGLGKLFYSQEALQTQTEINMEAAKKGAYFMVIAAKDGKRMYWKLVKE